MSNAKKCDICGVYYTEDSKEEENRPKRVIQKALFQADVTLVGVDLIFSRNIDHLQDGFKESKDLCGRCAKELYERFSNKS